MTFRLLVLISIIMSGCSKNVSDNNGNRYAFEPLPFKYEEDGKWGFIDLAGNVIIEPTFSKRPDFFQNGFAIIRNDTVSFYINTKGDTLGTYHFGANQFSDNRALIRDKKGELYFINASGTAIIKVDTIAKNQLRRCSTFSDGMALFLTIDNKYGYIDTSGNVVIEPKYSTAKEFAEELAYAEIDNDTSSSTEKMLINKKGEVVRKFDESLEWINPFNEGKAAFKDSSGCGYFDSKGEIIIQQNKEWDDLSCFINGYASYMCGGDWGVIDSTGKKVLSAVYEMPPFFYNGLAIVKENNKYGVIDLKGNKVIEALYQHIAYPLISDYWFAKDGKYYVMLDKNGKIINEKEIYKIDLLSAMLFGFKSGYIVVGEKLGISLSNLIHPSTVMTEMRTELNNELAKLYSE